MPAELVGRDEGAEELDENGTEGWDSMPVVVDTRPAVGGGEN